MNRKMFTLLISLVLLVSACGGVGQSNANATTTATATAIQARYSRITNGTPTLNNLMSDSKWVSNQENAGTCHYSTSDDVYYATAQSMWECSEFRTTFRNFLYQVQMDLQDAKGGGIKFRESINGWYSFHIGNDGSYVLEKLGQTLLRGNTSLINTGTNSSISLAVLADGDEIDLFINQHYVATVHDSTSTNGSIGVTAYDGDVAFRNAKIWTL